MEQQLKKDLSSQYQSIAMRVSTVSILANVFLTVFKLIAGFVAHSGAMISDAIHSASDVLSTFVVILGVRISGKKSDHDHPYGHERMECVASMLLAIFLAAVGIGIGWSGIQKIVGGNFKALAIPGPLALVAALVSIAVKEWMYWYTRNAAKKIKSSALMADAWHHRSDSLSSIGAFIGILGSRFGYPVLDPLASVIICLFILKAAFDIFKDATDKMVDHAADDTTQDYISEIVSQVPGVVRIDKLRTRMFGSRLYVDLEIGADGNLTLREAHKIAENVHDTIENSLSEIKHIMIHVNPAD